jgi:acetyltransferase-like isoleucine patch superfamily enzyme
MKPRLERALARYFHPCGLAPHIADQDQLKVYTGRLPDWWEANDNAAYVDKSLPPFDLDLRHPPNHPTPKGCLIICRSVNPVRLALWGEGSFIHIGRKNYLPKVTFACGEAAIFCGDNIQATCELEVNARNGGLVFFEEDDLIATRVQCHTDDMHSICDFKTGKRINKYGGRIMIGKHVWLGLEALLLGDTVLGNNSIVGARSVVKDTLPSNCVIACIPARVVRTGITWDPKDLPPEI